jgi:hypothetical protein
MIQIHPHKPEENLISLAIYAADLHSWSVLGYGIAIGSASTLTGGLIGVLFGIPRSPDGVQGTSTATGYRGNTNLEQISDWLTKILVGVGLVQLGRAPNALARLADSMKSGLALTIFLAVAGFMYLYLWSRIFLFRDLQDGEAPVDQVNK